LFQGGGVLRYWLCLFCTSCAYQWLEGSMHPLLAVRHRDVPCPYQLFVTCRPSQGCPMPLSVVCYLPSVTGMSHAPVSCLLLAVRHRDVPCPCQLFVPGLSASPDGARYSPLDTGCFAPQIQPVGYRLFCSPDTARWRPVVLLGSQCSPFVPVVLLGVLPHRGSESGLALMCTLSVVGQDGCLWLVSLLCLSAFELGSRAAFAPADVFLGWQVGCNSLCGRLGCVCLGFPFLFCSGAVRWICGRYCPFAHPALGG
jgi:hypothetical protein